MTPTFKLKSIQGTLGVVQDGKFGPKSRAALERLILEAERPLPAPVAAPASPGTLEFDERTERNLATLHPKAQLRFREFMAKLIPAMAAKGVVAKIISGSRTYGEQDDLYEQGRSKPGRIVTYARGGYSNHNFGTAIDIGLFKDGDYLEDSPLYVAAGPIGETCGLDWGGRWKKMKDYPHYEVKTGLSLSQMRARVAAGKSVL